MRAWWAYWATLGVGAAIWVGAAVVGGRDGLRSLLADPAGLAILVLPIVAAGLNLVLYRRSHEEVCRLEVQRHRSFRLIAGNGYSARAFGLTGVALILLAVAIVASQLSRSG